MTDNEQISMFGSIPTTANSTPVVTGLLENFVKQKVRETSGSRSSNRFAYQHNWSLCELLNLHLNSDDYLMVFEHHDDVVVFDSSHSPEGAIFYQVKSKTSGNWTVASLTKVKDGKPSVLNKLYDHHIHFSKGAKRLVFTSNQPLSAKLRSGEKSVEKNSVQFSELSDKEKCKISEKVESNQPYCDLEGLSKLETQRNDLRPDDHDTKAKGKLVEFFENFNPEAEVSVSLVYKTFSDEIKRKNNYEGVIESTDDLITHKSISRDEFQQMIATVVKRVSDPDLWQEANAILSAEGYNFSETRELKAKWQEYIINNMDASNENHLVLRRNIQDALNAVKSKTTTYSFKELTEQVVAQLSKALQDEYETSYLMASILYEEFRNEPISQINTQPSEEAK